MAMQNPLAVCDKQAEREILETICAGSENERFLVYPSIIIDIVKHFDQPNPPSCPQHIETALKELREVYEVDFTNVCSMRKVGLLNDFASKYLIHDGEKLPELLKKYAIAYGMRLSSRCKTYMAAVFNKTQTSLLDPSDFEEMETYASNNSPIARLLDAISKPGDVVLPSDIEEALPDPKMFDRMLVARSEYQSKIRRVQEVCEKRFRPIYKEVARPVTALSGAGFDYLSNSDEEFLKKHNLNKVLRQWSRIVFLCDSLRFVDMPKENDQDAGTLNLESVNYVSNVKVRIDTPFQEVPKLNKQLASAIEKFYGQSKVEVLRNNLATKSWSLIKSHFKYGDYKKLVKQIYKKLNSIKNSKVEDEHSAKDRELEFVNKEITDILSSDDKSITAEYRVLTNFGRSVKKGATNTFTSTATLPAIIYVGLGILGLSVR